MKKTAQRLKALAPILLMLVLALGLGLGLSSGAVTVEGILAMTEANKPLSLLVILGLYALKGCSAVIVFDVLVVAVAALFPMGEAIAINSVGLAVCLSVSFAVGRFTRAQTLESALQKHPKFQKYFRGIRDAGFLFCFAIHTLNLSLEVQGVLFGLMRIPFWKYLTGSFLAVAPGMLCFTIVGHDLSFRNPAFWIVMAVNLCMMAVGFWYTRKRVLAQGREEAPSG